jgi:phosphopantetheinyl transferase
MPLHTDRKINEHARIVLWKIEEPVDWFLSKLQLDDEEKKKYIEFRTDQRRAHWLAYRHILKNVVKKGNEIRVKYDENSKPFIDLSDDHISVSHSGDYAAVIISHRHPVGIDIERISPRLHKVADKFMNEQETGNSPDQMSTGDLCLHWSAKEALYKLYGKRNLDFKDHLHVVDPPKQLQGIFSGLITNGGRAHSCELFSNKIEDYILVYAIGSV